MAQYPSKSSALLPFSFLILICIILVGICGMPSYGLGTGAGLSDAWNELYPTSNPTDKVVKEEITTHIFTTMPVSTVTKTPSSPPSQNAATCLPETESFPAPEELKNYIGWKYNYLKTMDSYWGGELITKGEQDYGVSVFKLEDKSLVLVFEKYLCSDEDGHPAWEILDVLQTRPLRENERADIAYCKKDGVHTTEYPFVFIDKNNNGKVYQAWSINWALKIIVLASTEGLYCIVDGVES